MDIAFVASGGGAAQAFGVGVLSQLSSRGIKPKKFFGVSAGALIAAQYAFDGAKKLKEDWLAIKSKGDFLSSNYANPWSEGLYNTGPLKKRLETILSEDKKPVNCETVVGYCDLYKGKMVYVSSIDKRSDFIEATLASASLPGIMNTVNGKVDGGVMDVVPLRRAIDEGFKEIYLILASPFNIEAKEWKMTWPYPLSIARRAIDIMSNEVWENDLEHKLIHTIGDRKIIIHVYEHNPRVIETLEFDPKAIKAAIYFGENAKERLVY